MKKPKRIFIVADIKYKLTKMFVDQVPKLAKGFIRLGHDVRLFSYCNALAEASPWKSKNNTPDIVPASFARLLYAMSFKSILRFTASGK